jgi:2-polyprenyl-3-methyl-5-hydroxy-6-metoxy-1,4-benzoquinol methylase
LVRVDQQLVAETTREVYQGDAYGFVRSSRTDAFVDGLPHALRVLHELESVAARGRLLDIGCATGDFLVAARQAGWQTQGVELSAYAVEVARRHGLDVRVGTLTEAHLPPASFDAVTMLDVIEHLSDPLSELKEVHRVLRPGGIVCLETPNWQSIYRRLLRRRWAALQPRVHLVYFERRTATDLLERAGFGPIRATTEIAALFSPEGSARGFGLSFARSLLRDAAVRLLLRLGPRPWDRVFLKLGPAARADAAAGSFRQMSGGSLAPIRARNGHTPSAGLKVLRALNRPLDRLFIQLGMGEQLRIYARRR